MYFFRHILQIVVILAFTFNGASNLKAQDDGLLRSEIDAKNFDYIYYFPIEINGLITIQHTIEKSQKYDHWELSHYSSSFKQLYNHSFTTNVGYKLLDYFDDGDSLIYAFFSGQWGNSRFEVVKYNYINKVLSKTFKINDENISYDFFNVAGNSLFVSGLQNPSVGQNLAQFFYTLTLVPIFTGSMVYDVSPVLLIQKPGGNDQIYSGFNLKGQSLILSTRVHPITKNFAMFIRNEHKRRVSYHVFTFDSLGNLLNHLSPKSFTTNNILQGQLMPKADSSFLFIGIFNDDLRKRIGQNTYASGMFVSSIQNDGNVNVVFHPFSNFTNATQALDFRTKKKFENSRNEGETINFSFKLLLHENVLQNDSSYVVLAESYYPEYHQEIYQNFYGSMYSDQIFDGYRIAHAIAASFDADGQLLWDNYFEVSDIISYELQENVIVHFDGSTQVLLYYFDGKIHSKVISGSNLVHRKETTEVQTVDEHEKIVYENFGKIYHWYGPYFILTGYQVVANRNAEKRKVFFAVKLKFE